MALAHQGGKHGAHSVARHGVPSWQQAWPAPCAAKAVAGICVGRLAGSRRLLANGLYASLLCAWQRPYGIGLCCQLLTIPSGSINLRAWWYTEGRIQTSTWPCPPDALHHRNELSSGVHECPPTRVPTASEACRGLVVHAAASKTDRFDELGHLLLLAVTHEAAPSSH